MRLIELINRTPIPEPWQEGDNIPWNDPSFSRRMLKEHLSQEHNAASRKFERIDQHVTWIHDHVLDSKPSKILDLGCGPGLYGHRLSGLRHQYHGIDYSPASIDYARRISQEMNFNCTFLEADIREADYGNGYDLGMLINGELNVFRPAQAALILGKAFQSLKPNGCLLLEPHTFQAVQTWGCKNPSWYSSLSGLFSQGPHLVLEEYFWDSAQRATTNRYYTIDGSSGNVIRYAQSIQAYTQQDYSSLLEKCGYTNVKFYPSLIGVPDPDQTHYLVILATKPAHR